MNEYLNVIRNNYANFSGRARRREYWMFTLINTVILILLQIPVQGAVIAMAAQEETGSGAAGFTGVSLVFAGLIVIYALAVFVPTLAVAVRRLHDTGKSGWWYLISLVPVVGGLALLVFMVLDSEPGDNRWGPSPKGQSTVPAAANW